MGRDDQQVLTQDTGTERPSSRSPWLKIYPKNVDWHAPLTPIPLQSLLEQTAAHSGNKTCCYFLGRSFSYAEIDRLANRVAKGLQERGVGKGVNVGLFLPNSPAYIIFYYGILKAGGTVVNFNPLQTVEQLQNQVADAQVRILVTLDLKALFSKFEPLLDSDVVSTAIICPFADMLPSWKSVLFKLTKKQELADWSAARHSTKLIAWKALIKNDGKPVPPCIDPENDLAAIQYTCGTTGVPKGAMLTHANISINTEQTLLCVPEFGRQDERVMAMLPFFHVFGMTVTMNTAIAKGAMLLLLPTMELDKTIDLIRTMRPTAMPCLPTQFSALMNAPELGPEGLSDLRLCISGGAPLPDELRRRFEKASGCKILEGYGLTETSPTITGNLAAIVRKPGSIGIPVPGTHLSIRSMSDPSKEVPLGEMGELCIGGPQLMKGYWQRPKETADVMAGNYLRTGDAAYMDVEGRTFIIDRIKDIMVCSGFQVYPRHVEEAIYQYPGVEEVIVIGIPDKYRGEAPKAYIKLKDKRLASEQEILKFIEAKLAKYQMPSQIEFRDELPKTLIGKLSKKELRAEIKADG